MISHRWSLSMRDHRHVTVNTSRRSGCHRRIGVGSDHRSQPAQPGRRYTKWTELARAPSLVECRKSGERQTTVCLRNRQIAFDPTDTTGTSPLRCQRSQSFQKWYPRYHGYFSSRRALKFHEVIATSPKVMGINALNFKPNFKCSPLKFVGDPRPRLWCALTSLGESLARVKVRGASTQHPLRARM